MYTDTAKGMLTLSKRFESLFLRVQKHLVIYLHYGGPGSKGWFVFENRCIFLHPIGGGDQHLYWKEYFTPWDLGCLNRQTSSIGRSSRSVCPLLEVTTRVMTGEGVNRTCI